MNYEDPITSNSLVKRKQKQQKRLRKKMLLKKGTQAFDTAMQIFPSVMNVSYHIKLKVVFAISFLFRCFSEVNHKLVLKVLLYVLENVRTAFHDLSKKDKEHFFKAAFQIMKSKSAKTYKCDSILGIKFSERVLLCVIYLLANRKERKFEDFADEVLEKIGTVISKTDLFEILKKSDLIFIENGSFVNLMMPLLFDAVDSIVESYSEIASQMDDNENKEILSLNTLTNNCKTQSPNELEATSLMGIMDKASEINKKEMLHINHKATLVSEQNEPNLLFHTVSNDSETQPLDKIECEYSKENDRRVQKFSFKKQQTEAPRIEISQKRKKRIYLEIMKKFSSAVLNITEITYIRQDLVFSYLYLRSVFHLLNLECAFNVVFNVVKDARSIFLNLSETNKSTLIKALCHVLKAKLPEQNKYFSPFRKFKSKALLFAMYLLSSRKNMHFLIFFKSWQQLNISYKGVPSENMLKVLKTSKLIIIDRKKFMSLSPLFENVNSIVEPHLELISQINYCENVKPSEKEQNMFGPHIVSSDLDVQYSDSSFQKEKAFNSASAFCEDKMPRSQCNQEEKQTLNQNEQNLPHPLRVSKSNSVVTTPFIRTENVNEVSEKNQTTFLSNNLPLCSQNSNENLSLGMFSSSSRVLHNLPKDIDQIGPEKKAYSSQKVIDTKSIIDISVFILSICKKMHVEQLCSRLSCTNIKNVQAYFSSLTEPKKVAFFKGFSQYFVVDTNGDVSLEKGVASTYEPQSEIDFSNVFINCSSASVK